MQELRISQSITLRDSKSIEQYLLDIGKVDLLSVDEEIDLACRIRTGDHDALEKLVKANLRFVVSVAKQYQNHYLPLIDLISEGNLGLLTAARRFDETRGFKFISYAVWWIRQSIILAISEKGRIVRLPLNRLGNLSKIKNAYATLEQQLERGPTNEELAYDLELTLEMVDETLKSAQAHVSVDAPFEEGEHASFLDVLENLNAGIADEPLAHSDSLKTDIDLILSFLTDREAAVIKMYFGIGRVESMSLNEIGDFLELTPERIRQIRDKALRRLRTTSVNLRLNTYLG